MPIKYAYKASEACMAMIIIGECHNYTVCTCQGKVTLTDTFDCQ